MRHRCRLRETQPRSQSPRAFWSALIVSLQTKRHVGSGDEIAWDRETGWPEFGYFFVISKWLLPELSIPATGQKDRRLWGREWGFNKMQPRPQGLLFDDFQNGGSLGEDPGMAAKAGSDGTKSPKILEIFITWHFEKGQNKMAAKHRVGSKKPRPQGLLLDAEKALGTRM